ncbi:hypothetical protein V8C43DRAFT_214277 [Trichoderma afarasin]
MMYRVHVRKRPFETRSACPSVFFFVPMVIGLPEWQQHEMSELRLMARDFFLYLSIAAGLAYATVRLCCCTH